MLKTIEHTTIIKVASISLPTIKRRYKNTMNYWGVPEKKIVYQKV